MRGHSVRVGIFGEKENSCIGCLEYKVECKRFKWGVMKEDEE